MTFAIAPHALPSIPIAGSDMRFPVHRIYCIGRNYADHAREMGAAVDRGNPIFFAKPADAIVIDGYASRVTGSFSLPLKYAELVPTDVVAVPDADGNVYRVRMVRRTDDGFELS